MQYGADFIVHCLTKLFSIGSIESLKFIPGFGLGLVSNDELWPIEGLVEGGVRKAVIDTIFALPC